MSNAFSKTFNDHIQPKQFESIFEREPVDLETFLYDKAYLGLSIKLSERQIDVLRHSTQIYRPPELKLLCWAQYREVSEIYLQWGKGCFVGSEKVSLMDGRELSFTELCKEFGNNKKFWVYSCDSSGNTVPGIAHSPRITKHVNELVEVTLDNGKIITCTPDHKFMLRNGSYEQAQNLLVDNCLMTLHEKLIIKVTNIKVVKLEIEVPVYDITVEGYHNFALSSGVIVHNSGKDLISILTQARIADLLLCLKDPQAYWNTENIMPIDMINMAYNAEQAKFNFYEPFRRLIMRSPRFKHVADDKEKHIVFQKNVFAHSGHSDEDSAEGKSLILAVLDEISAFKTRQEFANTAHKYRPPKYSYEAMIDAMKSSRQSRFDTGKLIAISYPRYKGCPIQQLYSAGLHDNKKYGENSKVYVSFGATWEINPIKKESDFAEELKRNPGLVRSKYACDPSQAEDAFIKNFESIDETFPEVEETKIIHTCGDYPALKPYHRCHHDYACSVHVDLALNHCRAGFAMTHQSGTKVEKVLDMETGEEKIIELPIVTIDLLTSFQAPSNAEIDFAEIRRFLFSLRNSGYHISVVSYDQWNSAGERQTLEKAKFNLVKRSVDSDRSMYDDLVIMMNEKRLKGGYTSYRNYNLVGGTLKVCIIKEELQGLTEINGRKIGHRPNGTKDEADALVGSIRGAVEFGLWRFSNSLPAGQGLDSVSQPHYLNEMSEVAIVAQMKANNGDLRLPGNLGYKGVPGLPGR